MKQIFKSRKFYATILALFILVSGVFSPLVVSKQTILVNVVEAQGVLASAGWGQIANSGVCPFTVSKCFVELFEVIQTITHWFTSYAAEFFDWAIFYSIKSSTYDISFISEGWVIVRDLANMAFIFVLLYIAIQTILGIGHDTKKNIAAVIIIALLINFSMFFSKVIIDAGNILAHAFYNNIQGQDVGQNVDEQQDLAIVVVSKFNPQRLLTSDTETAIGTITPVQNDGTVVTTDTQEKPSGNSLKIMVLLFAIIADIMMIWVFLSVAFMMVGRIIGLAFAIIIAPIAFISNAVPGLKTAKYVGFDGWFKDLICLSFQPAVFIFFLFLILKFLDIQDLFINNTIPGEHGIIYIIKIMVPMIFVLLLIYISMKIVKSCGGEVAAMISGAFGKITAVGAGLALGGMALGGAMVGRQTLGRISKAAANDRTSQDAYNNRQTNPAAWNNLNSWQKFKGFYGSRTIGHESNERNKDHSEHVLNERAEKDFGKGTVYKDLDVRSKASVREAINRDLLSKEHFGKTYDNIDQGQRNTLQTHVAGFGGDWEAAAHDAAHTAQGQGRTLHTGQHLEDATKYGKGLAGGTERFLGGIASSTRTGSYDVRNISQITGLKGNALSVFGAKLMAITATAIRFGLKQGMVDHGKGQKDFWKDLGAVLMTGIEGASKAVEVKIDTGALKDHGGHDDHGGDGHGGGHH